MKSNMILLIVALLVLSGCAAQEHQSDSHSAKHLVTEDDYDDLNLKPRKEEPVYIDYEKDGTYRQSINIIRKTDTKEANQLKFIDAAASAPVDELMVHYDNGAKVNFRNARGETALIKVLDGPYDDQTLLKLEFLILVDAKLNYNGKSAKSDYTTPLGVAIWNTGQVFQSGIAAKYPNAQTVLEMLVEEGANISGLDAEGRTPLHIAAESNNIYAAELLLDAGTAVAPKDINDETPLDLAKSREMIQLLHDYGAEK